MSGRPEADRLSAHDTLYLASSSASLPLTGAGLFQVGRNAGGEVLTVERLRAHLSERLDLLPRFRQVVRPFPVRVAAPTWADDPAFALERHVRATTVPEPGGRRELESAVARLNDRALDPRRPLWEAHVLEGLVDGGTAMLIRFHHAMVDGMSAVHAVRVLLDGVPPAAGTRDLAGEPADVGPERRPGRLAGGKESLEGWLSLLRESSGPSRFRPGTGRTRWAMAALPERRLRAVARDLGASLNEMVAALAASAVAHVLAARGDARPNDSVRTLVPIVLPSGTREHGLGNRGAFFVTHLPVSAMDDAERVARVVEALRRGRSSGQVEALDRGMERLEGAPVPVILLFARLAGVTGTGQSGAIDLIVSFMPGPRRPLHLAGFPLEAAFPVLPIGPKARLGFGAVSLRGVVGIGVTAGTDVMPELDLFVHGLVAAARRLGVSQSDA